MCLLGHLPLSFHRFCGRIVAFLAFKVFRYRRDVVMINLSRSFPETKYKEIVSYAKKFYSHLGDVFAEAMWFAGCEKHERLRSNRIVQMTNPEELNRLYDNAPGLMIFTSHMGNWEIIGGILAYSGDTKLHFDESKVTVVYRKLSSKLSDMIFAANRITPVQDKEAFEGLVESNNILRFAMNHKKEKKVYLFNSDQHPYKGSVKLKVNDFMHQTTYAMGGAAALAKKLCLPVVYSDMIVQEDKTYKMTLTTICEDASKMEVIDIMNRYFELLQESLEAQPWNYLWTHKRWK